MTTASSPITTFHLEDYDKKHIEEIIVNLLADAARNNFKITTGTLSFKDYRTLAESLGARVHYVIMDIIDGHDIQGIIYPSPLGHVTLTSDLTLEAGTGCFFGLAIKPVSFTNILRENLNLKEYK